MKVCLKAASVTQQDSYFTVQTDSVPIRIWFVTDQILRIRAGFDGDFAEESYSPVFRRSTRKFPAFLFSLFSFLFPPLDFSLIYNKFLMPFRGFFYWKNFFDML